tara:strand:- start:666 stop:1403 length:738 start_codon:yes stop_codon:yes gene_type:complete
MVKDKLKWIDEELRAERKKNPIPNPNQEAFADALENYWGGDWREMATCTFRPNPHEMMGQTEDGEYTLNKKVSWLEGEKIVKRVGRDGQMIRGTRSTSPGWSAEAAERQIRNWINRDPALRKTRWALVIEPHKHRDCHHGHVLFSHAHKVNWKRAQEAWNEHGRFRIEAVKDDQGMAMYLAKRYVGKEYGSSKFVFETSRNCRRPKKDPAPKMVYQYQMMAFKNAMSKNPTQMLGYRNFCKKFGL